MPRGMSLARKFVLNIELCICWLVKLVGRNVRTFYARLCPAHLLVTDASRRARACSPQNAPPLFWWAMVGRGDSLGDCESPSGPVTSLDDLHTPPASHALLIALLDFFLP